MDLVEFLMARLDEDEEVARAAQSFWDDEGELLEFQDLSDWVFRHARDHSPARVLADIAAKRRIVDYREQAARQGESAPAEVSVLHRAQVSAYDATLRALTLAYADHPDFDWAWRP